MAELLLRNILRTLFTIGNFSFLSAKFKSLVLGKVSTALSVLSPQHVWHASALFLWVITYVMIYRVSMCIGQYMQ